MWKVDIAKRDEDNKNERKRRWELSRRYQRKLGEQMKTPDMAQWTRSIGLTKSKQALGHPCCLVTVMAKAP